MDFRQAFDSVLVVVVVDVVVVVGVLGVVSFVVVGFRVVVGT